jgi:hypothetical protein
MKSKNKYETEIEMELNLLATLSGITTKIVGIMGTLYGWIISIIAGILAYFAGLKILFIILNVILLADFVFGIWSAKIQKKHITSSKLRSTLVKTMIYGVIISLTYAVELSIGTLILYKILFAIASLIEMYSITANLLIIKPNMPFLKFFSRLVSGEIAEKLGISESEVENTLTNKNITGGTYNDNNN